MSSRCKLLVFLPVLFIIGCLFSVSAAADDVERTVYNFNDPVVFDKSKCDTSVNYWVRNPISTSYYTNAVFPYNIYDGSNYHNDLTVSPWRYYNTLSTVTDGTHYFATSGLSDYEGYLLCCFTVYKKATTANEINNVGQLFWFSDASGHRLPFTCYRNGVLTSGTNFGTPAGGSALYRFEVLVDCTQYRCERICNSLGFDSSHSYYYLKNSPNPFDNVVLYKYSDPKPDILFSTSISRNGLYTVAVSPQTLDDVPNTEYRAIVTFCDLDSIPSGVSTPAPAVSAYGLDNGYYVSWLSQDQEQLLQEVFVQRKNDLVSHLLRDFNDLTQAGAKTIYSELEEYFASETNDEIMREFRDLVDELNEQLFNLSMYDLGFSKYLLDENYISAVENMDFSGLRKSNYLGIAHAFHPQRVEESPPVFNTDAILGLRYDYYCDYANSAFININVGQFYNTYRKYADFPADNNIQICVSVYNDDNSCVARYISDMPIKEIIQGAFLGVGGSISDLLHTDILPLDSTIDYTPSGTDDITRLEHLLGVEALLDKLSRNMSICAGNIINALNASNTYVAYAYYNTAPVLPDIPPDIIPTYAFPSGVDSNYLDTARFITDYTNNTFSTLEIGGLIGAFVALNLIGFVLYGRRE